MSSRTINISDFLYEYLLDHSLREPELLQRLREETGGMPNGMMQISPEQGQFMGLLVRLIGALRILEIGVFTGYSSLSMALSLPGKGTIVACDISDGNDVLAIDSTHLADCNTIHVRPCT